MKFVSGLLKKDCRKEVGGSRRKRGEGWKDEKPTAAVKNLGAQGNTVHAAAGLEEMMLCLDQQPVFKLHMRLEAAAVAEIRCSEEDHTRNQNTW